MEILGFLLNVTHSSCWIHPLGAATPYNPRNVRALGVLNLAVGVCTEARFARFSVSCFAMTLELA